MSTPSTTTAAIVLFMAIPPARQRSRLGCPIRSSSWFRHSLMMELLPKTWKTVLSPDARTEMLVDSRRRSKVKSSPRPPASCSTRIVDGRDRDVLPPPGNAAYGGSFRRLDRLGEPECRGLPVDQTREDDHGPVFVAELELFAASGEISRIPLRLPGGRRGADRRKCTNYRNRHDGSLHSFPLRSDWHRVTLRLYRKPAVVTTEFHQCVRRSLPGAAGPRPGTVAAGAGGDPRALPAP